MNTRINKIKKIAIIGCGYWGTIITKTLVNLGYKNIYAYDSKIKNTYTLKRKFKKINIIKNYNQILLNKNIIDIFYATPPSKNFELIKKSLKHKKRIFLEKPGVLNSRELKNLNKIRNKNNNQVMFGYVYCFNDFINYIKKYL